MRPWDPIDAAAWRSFARTMVYVLMWITAGLTPALVTGWARIELEPTDFPFESPKQWQHVGDCSDTSMIAQRAASRWFGRCVAVTPIHRFENAGASESVVRWVGWLNCDLEPKGHFVMQTGGWPVVCTRSKTPMEWEGDPRQRLAWRRCVPISGGFVLPGRMNLISGWGAAPRPVMPMDPYYPGLLFNASFYGLILFLLLRAPRLAREGRRARRGQCPRCAYDIRADFWSGCPECG